MGNSCTGVFPNTRAWEQQERNKTKKQTKMVRSKAGTNKRFPNGLSHPNQNTIIIKNMVIFYNKWEKYNVIQLTKNKMDLNNRKKNHPSSLGIYALHNHGDITQPCLNSALTGNHSLTSLII